MILYTKIDDYNDILKLNDNEDIILFRVHYSITFNKFKFAAFSLNIFKSLFDIGIRRLLVFISSGTFSASR